MVFNPLTDERMVAVDQVCAAPFRFRDPRVATAAPADLLEFCLITSSSGLWMFPKGGVEDGETFAEAALKEAEEEAGIMGRIVGGPLGWYSHPKGKQTLNVLALPMLVDETRPKWKEQKRRERQWVNTRAAALMLKAPPLRECLAAAVELAKQVGQHRNRARA